MIAKKIKILIKSDGSYLDTILPPITANEDGRTIVQVIAPFPITDIVSVNYSIRPIQATVKGSYLVPTGKFGKDVLANDYTHFQTVADWNVFEIPINAVALEYISKYRAGLVLVSFAITQLQTPYFATNYLGLFSNTQPIPATSYNDGDYFIANEYNFTAHDITWAKGDYAYFYNGKWNKGKSVLKASTPSIELPVDPSLKDAPQLEYDEDVALLLANDLGLLTQRVSQSETDIESAENDINEIDGRVGVNETDIYNLESDVDDLETEIGNIKNGTTIVKKAEQDQLGNVINTTYETKIDATSKKEEIDGRLDTAESDIDNLQFDVLENTGDIADLQTNKVPKTTKVIGIDLQDDILLTEFKTALGNATQSVAGLLSAEDKTHLDGLVALLENSDGNTVVDTIGEILAIFNNYPEGADLVTALNGKVDKVAGKGLSTNDYTNTDKQSVEKIPTIEQDILDLESDKVDKNNAITAGTKTKITYDAKGLVTGGADLVESDIPQLPPSKITQDANNRFVTDTEKSTWNGKVSTSDIVDNLTSTDTNKPLSANQGKALDEKKIDDAPNNEFIYVRSKNNWEKLILKSINRAYPDATRISGMVDVGDGWFRIGEVTGVTLDYFPSLAEKGIQRYRLNGTRTGGATSLIINEDNTVKDSIRIIEEISGSYTYVGTVDGNGCYLGNSTTGYMFFLSYAESVFINDGERLRITIRQNNSFDNLVFDLKIIFPTELGMGFVEKPEEDGHTKSVKNGEWGDTLSNPSYHLRPYWKKYLDTKSNIIQQKLENIGRNRSSFYWYTDAHWTARNEKVTPDILKYLYDKTTITKTNFGGDIIDELADTRDEMKWLYDDWRLNIKSIPNHHSVVGNHDVFSIKPYATHNWTYTFLFEPEEKPNIVVGGDFYYYIDNPSEKTRYLYLSTGTYGVSVEEGQFFVEALESLPSGWNVVAISHIWFTYTNSSQPTVGSVPEYAQQMLNLFDAFNEKTSGNITLDSSNIPFDFTLNVGKVAFCIGGHIHTQWHFFTDGGIPVILTPPNARQPRGDTSTMVAGTLSETSICAVICDYEKEKIYLYYIGVGSDEIIEYGEEPIINNVLETVGWSENTRVNSSGVLASWDGVDTSGLIEFTKGDVIRLKNIVAPANDAASGYASSITLYDDGGAYITAKYLTIEAWDGTQIQGTFDGDGNCIEFTLNQSFVNASGYFRISANIDNTSILTINEIIP